MGKELSFNKIKLITRGGDNYYIRPSILGKQRTLCLETSDMKLAERRLKRFIRIFNLTCDEDSFEDARCDLTGKERPQARGKKLSIDDLIEHHKDFNEHASNARPIKENSMVSYEYRMRAIARGAEVEFFQDFEGKSLTEITRKINPDSKATTISNNFRIISSYTKKSFVHYLKERGIEIANPFTNELPPKVHTERYTPFGKDMQKEIWDDCEHLGKAQAMIVKMALGIGLRRSEIAHAQANWFTMVDRKHKCKVQTFTLPSGQTWTPKSKINRTIPISKELYDYLHQARKLADGYVEGCPWMIPSCRGGVPDSRLHSDMVSVLKWLSEKGIKDNSDNKLIHKLRKQFGSAIVKNQDMYAASVYLGHRSITTTEKHYVGLMEEKEANIF